MKTQQDIERYKRAGYTHLVSYKRKDKIRGEVDCHFPVVHDNIDSYITALQVEGALRIEVKVL